MSRRVVPSQRPTAQRAGVRPLPSRRAARAARSRAVLVRALVPAAAVAGMALLAAYAILGPNGLIALGDYKRQIAAREKQYVALDERRTALRNKVGLLDPRHANPDMVDELVRKQLNVAHPDEVIIPVK